MAYVIGLDIGGTKIAGTLFNGKAAVKELTIVTPKTNFEFEKNLLKLCDFLSTGKKIAGIGIGMAGVIDAKRKVAVYSPNIPYIKNFNFNTLFRSVKLAVGNDAKCFALAEAMHGRGKGKLVSVGLILGTGVGSGFIVNGKIFNGANFGAGEVGHMVNENDRTFESLYKVARDKKDNATLTKIVGAILNNICRAFDPDVIVLGGGAAMDKKRNFVKPAIALCHKLTAPYKIKTQVCVTNLKNAGTLGAALLLEQ